MLVTKHDSAGCWRLRRPIPVLALAASFLSLVGGCMGIEYEKWTYLDEEKAIECFSPCKAEPYSGYDFSEPTPEDAGSAVALGRWGGSTDEDMFSVAFVGAPAIGSGTSGHVFTFAPGTGSGELGSVQDTLSFPGGYSGESRFGFSLLAVDLYECEDDGAAFRACGDEFIVGAPGDGSGGYGGTIVAYYVDGSSPNHWTAAAHFRPGGLSPGARFGYALTEIMQDQEFVYVAVGAPGENKTYVLKVDRSLSSPDPIVVHEELVGHGGFGASLAAGNFDGDPDNLSDLAVGAPYAEYHGRVFVYRNVSGDSGWTSADRIFSEPPAVAEGPGTSYPWSPPGTMSKFGTAMAVGHGWHGSRDALLIGAPNIDYQRFPWPWSPIIPAVGAIGSFGFGREDSDGDGVPDRLVVTEHANMYNPFLGANDEFGYRLAVGHFDGGGEPRVAVSRPGYNGDGGEVIILCADGGALDDTILNRLHRDGGEGPNARFGSALASDYIEEHPPEDLLIGAPGFDGDQGHVTLTRAPCNDCEGIRGVWECYDAEGNLVQVEVTYDGHSNLIVRFYDDAVIYMRNGDGDICEVLGVEVSGEIEADTVFYVPWTCGETAASKFPITVPTDVGRVTIEAQLVYMDGEIELALDEDTIKPGSTRMLIAHCEIDPNPITFTLAYELGSIDCECDW